MSGRCLGMVLALVVAVGAGCSGGDRHPQALVEGIRQIPMLKGSAVRYLSRPVSAGMTVRFGVEESASAITGDGWLVWVDEQPDTLWPHAAILVWVPADPGLMPRMLRKGRLHDNARVFLADGREWPRRTWNHYAIEP
jgi:hypothetical protein